MALLKEIDFEIDGMTECWYEEQVNHCEEHEEMCNAWAVVNERRIEGTCAELRELWGIPDPEEEEEHNDWCDLEGYCYYEEYYCYMDDCYPYEDEKSWDESGRDCNEEFECEFVECEPEEHTYGEGTCWKELCRNECEDEECMLWHAVGQDAAGNWEWQDEACPSNFEDEVGENFDQFVSAFDDSMAVAFNEWCPNNLCVGEQGGQMTA